MFPFSLPSPSYHGNTLSLTIAFVSLVDFQNERKMTLQLSGVAGSQEPKKQVYSTDDKQINILCLLIKPLSEQIFYIHIR